MDDVEDRIAAQASPRWRSAAAGSLQRAQALVDGTAAPETLRGGAGPDLLVGHGGDDVLQALAGNDLIDGGEGDDRIDGGAGEDTARFRSTLDEVQISYDADSGWFTVSSALDGVDYLRDVEVFSFGGQRIGAWLFSTPWVPTPVQFSPGAGALDVSVESDLVITFSEPIEALYGEVVQLREAAGAGDAEGLALSVTVDGNHLRIDPAAPLKPGTSYVVELPQFAVADADFNFSEAAQYSFRTQAEAELLLPDEVSVNEHAGLLRFELRLSAASAQEVVVTLHLLAGTATPASDLAPGGPRVLRFAPGQTSLVVELPVTDDALLEADEVFLLRLSTPVGALLGRTTTEVTIVDDDAPPDVLPADPLLRQQWHLYAEHGVNAVSVWPELQGGGVRVGVLDDGIDSTHEDLYWVDETQADEHPAEPGDELDASGAPVLGSQRHGTAVAGVIGAGWNEVGSVGVAPDAALVELRTSGPQALDLDDVLAHVLNDHQGLDVLDLGGLEPGIDGVAAPCLAAALAQLAQEGRVDGLGTTIVLATGDDGPGGVSALDGIRNSRHVTVVGATDAQGAATAGTAPGAFVLVAAPGGAAEHGFSGILTADVSGIAGYSRGDFASVSGSAFAAASVSGVIALVLQANAWLGYRDVQKILAFSARATDPAHTDWRSNGGSGWNGGGLHFDSAGQQLGFGLVDAHAAVRLAETWYADWSLPRATAATLVEHRIDVASPAAIPDGQASLRQSVDVAQAMAVERVEVHVDLQHVRLADLSLRLVSPAGTESRLMTGLPPDAAVPAAGATERLDFTFSTVLSLGERAAGRWTLELMDGHAGGAGQLNAWSLTLLGSDPGADDVFVYTDEFGDWAAAQPARAVLVDGGGRDVLNAAAITSGSLIDLQPGAQSRLAGQALQMGAATEIEVAFGGDGDDTLAGNAADNELHGMRGDDTLVGRGGDDLLDGGDGIDTARYGEPRALYALAFTINGWTVDATGGGGRDLLVDVERIAFADLSIALDIGRHGHAGEAAQILRALFGPAGLANRSGAGQVLQWLDDGLDYDAVVAAALGSEAFAAQFNGPHSNADFVRLIYRHVGGYEPAADDAPTLAHYTALLDSGAATPAQLAALASRSEANVGSVDLAGLASSGLAYLLPGEG